MKSSNFLDSIIFTKVKYKNIKLNNIDISNVLDRLNLFTESEKTRLAEFPFQ